MKAKEQYISNLNLLRENRSKQLDEWLSTEDNQRREVAYSIVWNIDWEDKVIVKIKINNKEISIDDYLRSPDNFEGVMIWEDLKRILTRSEFIKLQRAIEAYRKSGNTGINELKNKARTEKDSIKLEKIKERLYWLNSARLLHLISIRLRRKMEVEELIYDWE